MPLTPTLAEVIRGAIDGKLLDVHTAMPGRIKSYNRHTQTAEVIPVINGVIFTEDDELVLEELPVIPNVPVAWPRGGGYSLQFPLKAGKAGDFVWLIFSETAMGTWRFKGETQEFRPVEPGDLRRHDLSYPIAVPAIAPDALALPALDGPSAPTDLATEGAIDAPGPFRIGGPSADFVALASKVADALTTLKQAITNAVPIAMDGGVGLQNTILAALTDWPPSMATTKLKGE